MSLKWKRAEELCLEAAAIIRERGSLRDGETDLIDEAAAACGRSADVVLDVMLALKHVRFLRAGDWDSAVDFIAYKARAFANGASLPPIPEEERRARIIEALEAYQADDVDSLRAGGSE